MCSFCTHKKRKKKVEDNKIIKQICIKKKKKKKKGTILRRLRRAEHCEMLLAAIRILERRAKHDYSCTTEIYSPLSHKKINKKNNEIKNKYNTMITKKQKKKKKEGGQQDSRLFPKKGVKVK